jgi:P-type Ca2+ transporter type 2C
LRRRRIPGTLARLRRFGEKAVGYPQGVEPYRLSPADLAAGLATDLTRGLDAAEARARLARDGPNELTGHPPIPAWRRFLAQFGDVLVILLLVATAVSAVLWLF